MYWLLDLLFASVCCGCQCVCLWADVVRLLIDDNDAYDRDLFDFDAAALDLDEVDPGAGYG